MDLHAQQLQGFFDIPVDNLMGASVLIPYIAGKFGRGRDDVMIISPDLGSVTRCRKFCENYRLAIIDKRRPRANVSEVMNIIGDVKGKTCILSDDLIDTAGTLCHAAEALIKIGGAKEVYACASHGVLSGPAIQRLEESPIKKLTLLDTINLIAALFCRQKSAAIRLSCCRLLRYLPRQSHASTRNLLFPRCLTK